MSMKEELDTMREKLEQFERLKLKENKRSKELLEMIRYAATPSFGSEQENWPKHLCLRCDLEYFDIIIFILYCQFKM